MARVRRHLLNLLTALSQLLCVLLAAALVRSVVTPEVWVRMTADEVRLTTGQDNVASASGFFQYSGFRDKADGKSVQGLVQGSPHMLAWTHLTTPARWLPSRAWFVPVYHRVRRPDRTTLTVAVPYLPLVLLTAVLPALWLRRARRQRRARRANLCPSCGYDLRATPDRCPECGAEPARTCQSDRRTPRGQGRKRKTRRISHRLHR
jgi:hypothetical protein